MPATQQPKLTQCPACGARITRPELSLCSYCATPLGLSSKPEGASEATLARLAKMREHKDYAEALAWEPHEGDDAPGALPARRWGRASLALGTVFLVWGVAARLDEGVGALALDPRVLLGLVAFVVGLRLELRTRALVARLRRTPLERRPAIVIDRRSETSSLGLNAQTIYFFSLQFEDGSAGEFSFHGRGSNYEVPMSGTTGLACTRGRRLLEARGQVLSREQLHQRLRALRAQAPAGYDPTVDRSIDVQLSKIRSTLGAADPRAASLIRTVRGVGYILDDSPEAAG